MFTPNQETREQGQENNIRRQHQSTLNIKKQENKSTSMQLSSYFFFELFLYRCRLMSDMISMCAHAGHVGERESFETQDVKYV
jgi:hypothetical protein